MSVVAQIWQTWRLLSCYYTAFQKYDDVINTLQSILTDGASKSSFTPGVVNIALVGMESVDPKVK